ncbi:heme ABC transporter ATP-binding protein [Actinoalloteichus hymeniacidonis]|uniref:ABC-type hemin transport system, ATPase component n=1 Tax=Actinoalloteichus hymeniacidonis TaxID=340345 RepID=A0AAC9N1R4_9PSEU|nr:heme ABC transporter ATP-binding protein [Actinoalloteichus hymeniacidonis]AOS66076.1 ABC-type hemin transport system, ATPase component [Actinoalloteichus hymeniacidonis]MBB5905820.1 iron complex transport system ATP-binding protein [Actinoalloteichus hymeniacidonis]
MTTGWLGRWTTRRRPAERRQTGAVAISATGVGVRLGGASVLSGVDVDVRAGELLALVGPNGAGKSTLLAVLAGDRRPHAGTVRLDEQPLDGFSAAELARYRSVLPQHITLSFPFSVLDVVRMGRAPWRSIATPTEDEAAITEAMTRTGVTDFVDRPFNALSGGERARVALARVLAQQTGIVLLDEPTAALDLRHQEAVLTVARERAAEGDAVVVVLHDLGLAAAYAHRVAVLAEGNLVACGTAAEVLTPELLSEVYRHDIEVLTHPRTGMQLIVPMRVEPDGLITPHS